MKITIESTDIIVEFRPDENGTPYRGRIWVGMTESGIPVSCLIPRIAVREDERQEEFQRELSECAAPTPELEQAFPLKMVL